MDSPNVPAFDSIELKELKQKLVDGCRILDKEGIIPQTELATSDEKLKTGRGEGSKFSKQR